MNSVFRDYESRVDEINLYFDHITSTSFANQDTFKIMKANSFLMLYNLIESTVRNSLEEIHNAINNDNLAYDDCIDELKAIWIEFQHKKFKEKSAQTIINNLKNLSIEIISVAYADYIKIKSNDISGNIDRRKIDELSNKYNFKKNRLVGGRELFTIKNIRNALAHGNQSFLDVGKNHDIEEIKKIKRVTILYLKEMLYYINDYIIKKSYKELKTA